MAVRGPFIDGRTVTTTSGGLFTTRDPATRATVATVVRAGAAEVDAAVASAARAWALWRRWPPAERGRTLLSIAVAIDEQAEALAELESRDTGKPLREARTDVAVAARYFEYYAGAVDKVFGETIPTGEVGFAWTIRQPIGVVGQIVPWNYPFAISARTVAPALAAGNTCVLKPASAAPLTPLRLAEIAVEAGLPRGALNVVPGPGSVVGRSLINHRDVGRISFTGSVATGRRVMAACAKYVRPVTLELGGKSPHIVFADADLALAIPTIVQAIVHNAGQTCSAGSRVLVERSIADVLVEALAAAFAKIRMGRGLDDPDMGPLISGARASEVLRQIRRAESEGAQVVFGGERVHVRGLAGHFVAPTLLSHVQPEQPIAREEVFGPVLSVLTFNDEHEAVRLANDTPYGLVAAIWTANLNVALATADRLEAGQVFVNSFGGGVELPFGGWKASGLGSEKGLSAMLAYTRTKIVAAAVRGAPSTGPLVE